MHHSNIGMVFRYNELCDFIFLHNLSGFYRQFISGYLSRIGAHYVLCLKIVEILIIGQHTADIAIGNDSEYSVIMNNAGCAKSALGDAYDYLFPIGGGAYRGSSVLVGNITTGEVQLFT